jgi:hypothetical protein
MWSMETPDISSYKTHTRFTLLVSLNRIRYFLTVLATTSVVQWSEFLATDPEARVRFPALLDFLRSSGSGTGSTQPRDYN